MTTKVTKQKADILKDRFCSSYARLSSELNIRSHTFKEIELLGVDFDGKQAYCLALVNGKYHVAYQFNDQGGRFWKREYPTFDAAFRALQGVLDRNLPDEIVMTLSTAMLKHARNRNYGIAMVSGGSR